MKDQEAFQLSLALSGEVIDRFIASQELIDQSYQAESSQRYSLEIVFDSEEGRVQKTPEAHAFPTPDIFTNSGIII